MEEINKKLDQLGNTIDSKLELFKNDLGEEFKKELKGEVDGLTKTYLKMQEQLDSIDMKNQRQAEDSRAKSFDAALKHELGVNGAFKAFSRGEANKAQFSIKADLTTAANASGEVGVADRVVGVKYDPTRSVRVRDILAKGSTGSNVVRFLKENSYTNNAATRAEAAAYGESEFILTYEDAAVRSIGSTISLTKEMLEDIDQMNSYISARLPQKVLNVEDAQLLSGNGTAPNLQGLAVSGGVTAFDETSAGAFYQFFAAGAADEVSEYDVLIAAINQATLAEYTPSGILLNPTDYHKMLIRKDTTGQYVAEIEKNGTIMGVPVYKSTAQTAGSFIVGDFAQGAQMFNRSDLTVEFSDQNSDNFEKDLITVKASERIALAIYNPNAFAYGTFSGAIAALHA